MHGINIGDNVFVRSNTRDDYVGKLVAADGIFVTLDQCSWVAESGRFHAFMRDGRAEGMEIEPIGDNWTVCVSAIKPWNHALFEGAV